jgi:hypothetical protein
MDVHVRMESNRVRARNKREIWVGMARCAVRAAFSGATTVYVFVRRVISFRPLNAGGDIAGAMSLPSLLNRSDRFHKRSRSEQGSGHHWCDPLFQHPVMTSYDG